jgi:hypothetical protein
MGGIIPEPETGELWYFAYGSMCNPVSLKRRGIHPRASLPAKLEGYSLLFNTTGGMANIEPSPDSSFHGILHLITEDMFKVLHEIEAVYDAIDVPCVPYESQAPITAKAFIIPPHKLQPTPTSTTLPSERYMTIIVQGLRHFNASQDWITKLEGQPFTPGRKPCQYLKVPPALNPEQLPTMTMEELKQYKGKLPAVYAIGNKVVRADASSDPDHPMAEVLRKLVSGTQAAYIMCMNLYEPRLPEVRRH